MLKYRTLSNDVVFFHCKTDVQKENEEILIQWL